MPISDLNERRSRAKNGILVSTKDGHFLWRRGNIRNTWQNIGCKNKRYDLQLAPFAYV